jgi:histone deacetylase 1/2
MDCLSQLFLIELSFHREFLERSLQVLECQIENEHDTGMTGGVGVADGALTSPHSSLTTSSPTQDQLSPNITPTAPQAPVTPRPPPHPMTTRAKAGIFKPHPKYAMAAMTPSLSPIPTSACEALQDPNWRAAMQAEYGALLANHTWTLVGMPADARIITGKWVFHIKLNSDDTLNHYKARWVVCGFHQ